MGTTGSDQFLFGGRILGSKSQRLPVVQDSFQTVSDQVEVRLLIEHPLLQEPLAYPLEKALPWPPHLPRPKQR